MMINSTKKHYNVLNMLNCNNLIYIIFIKIYICKFLSSLSLFVVVKIGRQRFVIHSPQKELKLEEIIVHLKRVSRHVTCCVQNGYFTNMNKIQTLFKGFFFSLFHSWKPFAVSQTMVFQMTTKSSVLPLHWNFSEDIFYR